MLAVGLANTRMISTGYYAQISPRSPRWTTSVLYNIVGTPNSKLTIVAVGSNREWSRPRGNCEAQRSWFQVFKPEMRCEIYKRSFCDFFICFPLYKWLIGAPITLHIPKESPLQPLKTFPSLHHLCNFKFYILNGWNCFKLNPMAQDVNKVGDSHKSATYVSDNLYITCEWV